MESDIYDLVISAPGRNAMSRELMQHLIDSVRSAAGRPLLLRGSDGVFSAGLNLRQVAELDEPGMADFLRCLDELMDVLYEYPGPSVACVDGHAIAGGCVMALCCDWRVATSSPSTRIGLNEVARGLEFPPKILNLVRDRVPRRHIERVVLEAALFDPATACTLGLVDEVADDPLATARAALARLAAVPRKTYTATKQTLRAGILALSAAQRQQFDEQIVPAWCAPETKALLRAALQKRG